MSTIERRDLQGVAHHRIGEHRDREDPRQVDQARLSPLLAMIKATPGLRIVAEEFTPHLRRRAVAQQTVARRAPYLSRWRGEQGFRVA
jgi:hypothetical protein